MARVTGRIEDRNHDGVYDRFAHILNGTLAVVRLAPDSDVDAAIAALRQDPDVLYAERNYIVAALVATPDDSRFSELYGLDNAGQTGGTPDADIDAPEAWDDSVGSSDVVVGVIDTGVDYTHEDLAANMWVNPGEIPGNGIDDEGNGVIDDVHGFNSIDESGDPFDDHSHGTHCAGTVGAVGNNGVGVAGVNWEVQIMAIKWIDADGFGSTEDAIEAVDYAVAQRDAGVNLRVLSNSWRIFEFSQALQDAIAATDEADMLFVAAAGNESSNIDVEPVYPASFDVPNIVSVAATDDDDQLAGFSNFGPNSVDLGGPGVAVLSTVPGNNYDFFSGTSMATPHVAGVAALVLSTNDTLTADELKDILLTSGDPIPALEGLTVSGQRLNAASALAQAGPPVPRFSLGVSPASIVVTQEETATYNIDVASLAGFAGDVALSVAVDPAIDATVTITPVVTAPGTGSLAVATTTATATGLYSLTITGTAGDLVRTRTVSLRVRAPGDPLFGITVLPDSESISQGGSTSFAVAVESFGFTGDVFLGVTSEPEFPGGFDLFPNPVTAPGAAELGVFTDCGTPPGDYTLTVTGVGGSEVVSANALLTVLPAEPTPPFVEFFAFGNGLTFEFFDFSFPTACGANEIVSWFWDFGDGNTSDEQFPTHTYAAPGDYTVTLTVTDNIGLSGSASQTVTVTPPPPELHIFRITRNPAQSLFRVDLRWSGAEGNVLELYRNGLLVDALLNDGEHRDRFQSDETFFSWLICQPGNIVCSNEVFVDFGPNPEDNQAKVHTAIDGEEIIRTVTIEDEQ